MTHSIDAWPDEALNTYRLWLVLERCQFEENLILEHLSSHGIVVDRDSKKLSEFKNKIYGDLVAFNAPVKVEATDDDMVYTKTVLPFSETFGYIQKNLSWSVTFYPTHYPTQESHNQDIDFHYQKYFGQLPSVETMDTNPVDVKYNLIQWDALDLEMYTLLEIASRSPYNDSMTLMCLRNRPLVDVANLTKKDELMAYCITHLLDSNPVVRAEASDGEAKSFIADRMYFKDRQKFYEKNKEQCSKISFFPANFLTKASWESYFIGEWNKTFGTP